MTQKQYWIGVITRAFAVIAIIYLAYFIIVSAFPLVFPFLIALAISLAIEPIVRRLETKAKIPRWLSVSLILLLLLSILFSLVIFIVAEIVVELTNLSNFLPQVFQEGQQFFTRLFTQDNNDLKRLIDTLQDYLKQNPDHQQKIAESISSNLGTIANKGTQIISDLLAWLGNIFHCARKNDPEAGSRSCAHYDPSRHYWNDRAHRIFRPARYRETKSR